LYLTERNSAYSIERINFDTGPIRCEHMLKVTHPKGTTPFAVNALVSMTATANVRFVALPQADDVTLYVGGKET
jgi:hypothetical protein